MKEKITNWSLATYVLVDTVTLRGKGVGVLPLGKNWAG